MSNFPRNKNQEFIENVFTCYKMFLRRFSTNFKFPWHTVLGWKTIKCKCFERECSYFLGSWLSLKFNSNHCSSSLFSMLKCITRRILNLMPSCVKASWKQKCFYIQTLSIVVIHGVVANFSKNYSFSPSIFLSWKYLLSTYFLLKWMFYVLTQAHISYFSFYQCSTLFRKLFFLQSFNTSPYMCFWHQAGYYLEL